MVDSNRNLKAIDDISIELNDYELNDPNINEIHLSNTK